MISSFHGIELGKKGLLAHQSALNTTGHNLSNVSNPNYSRQKVQMSTAYAIHPPGINVSPTSAGQIGGGSVVEDISRVRDAFVDDRIANEKGTLGYWKYRDFFLKQLEAINSEPDTPSMQSRFESFVNSWNNLANNPKEGGARQVLKTEGLGLTSHIRNTFNNFLMLRKNADKILTGKVFDVNTLSSQIAKLNLEIQKIKAEKNKNPNDLLDRRDALVEELSAILPIRVGRMDKDEFIVYVGSDRLIQGDKYENLLARKDVNNEGFSKVLWSKDERELILSSGELGGLIKARDTDIKAQVESLDTFTINLIEATNAIHKDGFGLNLKTGIDFFREEYLALNVNSNYDANNDGLLDGSAFYKVSGGQSIENNSVIGSNGTLNLGVDSEGLAVLINYFENDKVSSLIERINKSPAPIVAHLNHKGNLVLKSASNNFMINHIEDSGNFLVGFAGILRESGQNGGFDATSTEQVNKFMVLDRAYSKTPRHHPSSWIELSSAIIREPNNIAAAKGKDTDGDSVVDSMTGESDGRNALRIVATLRSESKYVLDSIEKIDHNPIMLDKHSKGFHSFLSDAIQNLGSHAKTAVLELKKEEAIVQNLMNTKESISGVNVDEEMASLVMYQHGYNASARFVTYVDRMLDTIINRMGA